MGRCGSRDLWEDRKVAEWRAWQAEGTACARAWRGQRSSGVGVGTASVAGGDGEAGGPRGLVAILWGWASPQVKWETIDEFSSREPRGSGHFGKFWGFFVFFFSRLLCEEWIGGKPEYKWRA